MKHYFKSIYNLEDDSQEKILYVLDSNFLSYAVQSINSSEQYFKSIEKVKNSLFVPFVVYVETIHNLKSHIKGTENVITDINNIYEKIENLELFNIDTEELNKFIFNKVTKGISDSTNGNINYKGNDGAKKKIEKIIQRISQVIKDDIRDINGKITDAVEQIQFDNKYDINEYSKSINERLKQINDIFSSSKILGQELTQKDIQKYIEIIEKRFEDNRGPGVKDRTKGDEKRCFGDIEFLHKYGDAILWLELIDFVKDNREYSKVLLVSDDVKSDWSEEKGYSELKSDLKIEFLQKTGKSIDRLTSADFISDVLLLTKEESKNISDEIQEFSDFESEYEFNDTLIIRAKKKGFKEVFLEENCWYSVRIDERKIPYIKYIAAYQTSPISKITHFAKVKDIVTSDEDSTKKKIIFDGEAQKLTKPIPLGSDWNALQSNRYTNFRNLYSSKDIDELLAKSYEYYQIKKYEEDADILKKAFEEEGKSVSITARDLYELDLREREYVKFLEEHPGIEDEIFSEYESKNFDAL
ncbi:TPA: PIN-like domain-containing protein [Streptococcus suis]